MVFTLMFIIWGGYGRRWYRFISVQATLHLLILLVQNMLVWGMYGFVAGAYRFTGWWYGFL